METAKTPYEEYLRQSLIEERARLDSLYNEFAKSNPIRKQLLKGKIDEALQNIDLLSKDLDKYMNGLSWLREPSKERDEKAEHLPKLEKEEAAPTPQAKLAAPGQAKPVVARPTIGKPIGSTSSASAPAVARPAVGAPVASRPKIGTPVGTPSPPAPTAPAPAPAQGSQPTAPRPVIRTPVKRPVIGTPIGKPKPHQDAEDKESNTTSSG
jgi:hypothetical protein